MEGVPDYVDLLACDRMEWEILQLLLLSSDDSRSWTVEEVMDTTADPITAVDAMARLCEVGLLRRKRKYIIITVAALRFYQFIMDLPRAQWPQPQLDRSREAPVPSVAPQTPVAQARTEAALGSETQEVPSPMPETQPNPMPADGEAHAEWGVLNLLIGPEEQRPWSVEEIIRERGDRVPALDAVDRLHATGLVHRTGDGFIFATRAAIRYSQIAG